MSVWLYVGIGVPVFLLIIGVAIYIIINKKKKSENPLLIRAKDTMVILTQRMHSMDKRIKKLDEEVTKLVIAQEKGDPSLSGLKISVDNIPTKIEQNKKEINEYIADIKDLKDYKREIEIIIKEKEKNWEELEKLLDTVKEKIQYRFI